MTTREHKVGSALRVSAAVVLITVAVLFMLISAPMRAGWNFVGTGTNASNTVVAIMQNHSVQVSLANQLETDLAQSSSPAVAKDLALHRQELIGAVETLMSSSVVQQLVALEVQRAYYAIQSQQATVLDFSPRSEEHTSELQSH